METEIRYAIARESTAEGDTFTVVLVRREDVSEHKTYAEAKAAIEQYKQLKPETREVAALTAEMSR